MKITTREIILIGLFAALMVVGAKLSIPTPFGVPLTFQLFFAVYAGLLLGARNGLMSQVIYIVIGLIGVPVFSTGGGIAYVTNVTFGFVIGFAIGAFVIGYIMDGVKELRFINILGISLIGYVVIYIIGNVYFYLMMNLLVGKSMSLLSVFIMMFPYMIKDIILLILASWTSTKIIPVLRRNGYSKIRVKEVLEA